VIGSTRKVRVFACPHPGDMRKGYDGLSAIVTGDLGRDPVSGELFMFANRTRKRAKVLVWDTRGCASTPSGSSRGDSRVCGAMPAVRR
jgi:transposase